MSEILNQNEVDALLSAVAKGEIASTPAAAPEDASAQVYDFTRPERVSKDRRRMLAALHEGFVRNLAAHLSSMLRRPVEAEVSAVEQATWGDFLATLANPACLVALSAQPLASHLVLEIEPGLAFPVIDRLLGGTGIAGVPARPMTEIEARLVQTLAAPVATLLGQAWGGAKPVEVKVGEVQSNPQLVRVAAPLEAIVRLEFRLRMGDANGRMNLCLPYAMVEPLLERFGAAASADARRESNVEPISRSLAEAELDVVADLAVTQITVRELLELEPGDLLKTDAGADSEAIVYVEGIPKFKGKPGRNRRNKAILVTRPIDPGKTR
jgi:flagellar motor switch protein FliM